MAYLSEESKANRDECAEELQLIINVAILVDDFSVGEAYRERGRHERLRAEGLTKVPYEKTMHRFKPSKAVHLIPYPTGWPSGPEDEHAIHQFYQLHGVIKAVAWLLGIEIRWGGDWDGDDRFADNRFDDLAHYELVDSEAGSG